jgi:hypothetical protein
MGKQLGRSRRHAATSLLFTGAAVALVMQKERKIVSIAFHQPPPPQHHSNVPSLTHSPGRSVAVRPEVDPRRSLASAAGNRMFGCKAHVRERKKAKSIETKPVVAWMKLQQSKSTPSPLETEVRLAQECLVPQAPIRRYCDTMSYRCPNKHWPTTRPSHPIPFKLAFLAQNRSILTTNIAPLRKALYKTVA